jgi:hypothetical protein
MKMDYLQIAIFQKVLLFLYQIGNVIAYYWGMFMSNEQVKSFYDERKRDAHRLMKISINEKYQFIDGDIRCAGTYINDAKGSSKDPNVIFENDLGAEELEYLIPIKSLRNIVNREELLIDYGDLFSINSDPMQAEQENNATVFLYIFISAD